MKYGEAVRVRTTADGSIKREYGRNVRNAVGLRKRSASTQRTQQTTCPAEHSADMIFNLRLGRN